MPHMKLLFLLAAFCSVAPAQQKAGRLLVECTATCTVKIDGTDKGQLGRNTPTAFDLTVGDHIVSAIGDQSTDQERQNIRKIVTIKEESQSAVILEFRAEARRLVVQTRCAEQIRHYVTILEEAKEPWRSSPSPLKLRASIAEDGIEEHIRKVYRTPERGLVSFASWLRNEELWLERLRAKERFEITNRWTELKESDQMGWTQYVIRADRAAVDLCECMISKGSRNSEVPSANTNATPVPTLDLALVYHPPAPSGSKWRKLPESASWKFAEAHQYAKAISSVEEALAANTIKHLNPEHYLDLAIWNFKLGDIENARKNAVQATLGIWFERGVAFQILGDNRLAEMSFKIGLGEWAPLLESSEMDQSAIQQYQKQFYTNGFICRVNTLNHYATLLRGTGREEEAAVLQVELDIHAKVDADTHTTAWRSKEWGRWGNWDKINVRELASRAKAYQALSRPDFAEQYLFAIDRFNRLPNVGANSNSILESILGVANTALAIQANRQAMQAALQAGGRQSVPTRQPAGVSTPVEYSPVSAG